jgi:hypothetical protein
MLIATYSKCDARSVTFGLSYIGLRAARIRQSGAIIANALGNMTGHAPLTRAKAGRLALAGKQSTVGRGPCFRNPKAAPFCGPRAGLCAMNGAGLMAQSKARRLCMGIHGGCATEPVVRAFKA